MPAPKVIASFPIRTDVLLPLDARIIHFARPSIGAPGGTIWVETHEGATLTTRKFIVLADGRTIPAGATHVDSWSEPHGSTFHLYLLAEA